ncbi:MAG: Rieske 2Fe-2S domain-containing protein [Acidimicrobiia bacterium]
MEIAVGVVIVLGLGAVALLATARTRAATGRLTRETRRADASQLAPGAEPEPVAGKDVEPVDDAARARADQSRRAAEGGSLVPTGEAAVARYEPVDLEELGVTRRQFFNRGILASLGVGAGAFGVASLAFLWPSTGGGFGDVVTVGSIDEIDDKLATKTPFYNAGARTYIQPYPKNAIKKAKNAYDSRLLPGMEAGYVALYQKCPHLGCRVPWCPSSQWFECPCHGSKYNRVGEKKGGPAPRGMDRFVITIQDDDIIVDTSEPLQGPPIGTDTTGQGQEGAPCV